VENKYVAGRSSSKWRPICAHESGMEETTLPLSMVAREIQQITLKNHTKKGVK